MLDNLGLYFITHFFGKHKAYTKIKGGYWIGVLETRYLEKTNFNNKSLQDFFDF
jgi:hypothetical protein